MRGKCNKVSWDEATHFNITNLIYREDYHVRFHSEEIKIFHNLKEEIVISLMLSGLLEHKVCRFTSIIMIWLIIGTGTH